MPHILIVDDELYQRRLLIELLSDDPTPTFSEASDGRQALETALAQRPLSRAAGRDNARHGWLCRVPGVSTGPASRSHTDYPGQRATACAK
jgi:CheY-like chemotaxis protein